MSFSSLKMTTGCWVCGCSPREVALTLSRDLFVEVSYQIFDFCSMQSCVAVSAILVFLICFLESWLCLLHKPGARFEAISGAPAANRKFFSDLRMTSVN